MLGFIGFLFLVCTGVIIALMVNGIIVAGRGRSFSSAVFDQEMFVVHEPVLADVPKRVIADTHWHVKAFMRPRRKG
ncbi:hypothetical protein ACQKII_14060 [Lysinibacillus sp. NPDC048646]|uniref:hypothetical protein n=1 Tax=Lysinibacillus sp. NPDC048646 TaxID=3390574 RepID=UPI003D03D97F